MSSFSFRVLNLLHNCFFYFNYTNRFLSEENYVKCTDEEKYFEDNQEKSYGFKQNIEKYINILKSFLEKLNIKILALLLDFIFEKLVSDNFYKSNKITNCKDRVEMEIKLNTLINSIISPGLGQEINYELYRQKHSAEQEQFVPLEKDSLMLLQNEEKNNMIINEPAYPYFEFFKAKKPLTRELLTNKLELIPKFESEYPILFNFFKFENNLTVLNKIDLFNSFLNEMINRFSYKITRKDAKL